MKLTEIKLTVPVKKPRDPNHKVLADKKNAGGKMRTPREGVPRDEKHKKPVDQVEEAKNASGQCKVRMLESWNSKLPKAIKKLGYNIDGQGYEDASTVWAVTFNTGKGFNAKDFRTKLRDELDFDGWMEVLLNGKLVEAVAGPFEKFSKDDRVKIKKTGEEVTVLSQNDIGLVQTMADDALRIQPGMARGKGMLIPAKGYRTYMPRELERVK